MARGPLAACLIAAACSAAPSRPSRRTFIHDIRAARPCTITLRGGADDARRVLSGFDQQLQDEILHDIKRSEQGKPPLFVEQLGDEEPHGAFKYGVGVEAAMPPAIGDAADAPIDDEGPAAAEKDGKSKGGGNVAGPAGQENQTHQQREAEELAEAMEWFAKRDEKFFHHSEMTAEAGEEPILGHTGMPQRRELMPGEPLENYLELRRDCAELSRFIRTLPRNASLIPAALDAYGWHDGIHRNGSRIKWTPDTRVLDMEPLSEESSVFEPKGGEWFHDAVVAVAREAYEAMDAAGTPASGQQAADLSPAAELYRQRNATFSELAAMRAFVNDTFILSCDRTLEELAGADAGRQRARSELWEFFDIKWAEFVADDHFPDDMHAAYSEVEANVNSRIDRMMRAYNTDRHIEYADPESEDVTTPWGVLTGRERQQREESEE